MSERIGARIVRKKWTGLWFILPSLLGTAVFVIVPFFASIGYAFTKGTGRAEFAGLANFRELFQNDAYRLAVKNTLLFILEGVPLLVVLGLLLGIALASSRLSFQRWALLIPMALPTAAALLGWQAVLGDNGPVNGLFRLFGGTSVDFFTGGFPRETLAIFFLVKNVGYMAVIFAGAVSSLPKEYGEAFALDSSSQIRYLRYIVLPSVRGMALFVCVLSLMYSFQIFREAYGLYGDRPPQEAYLLQHFMNNNFYKLNYQRLSTAALLLVLGISAVLAVFLWRQEKIAAEEGI